MSRETGFKFLLPEPQRPPPGNFGQAKFGIFWGEINVVKLVHEMCYFLHNIHYFRKNNA